MHLFYSKVGYTVDGDEQEEYHDRRKQRISWQEKTKNIIAGEEKEYHDRRRQRISWQENTTNRMIIKKKLELKK